MLARTERHDVEATQLGDQVQPGKIAENTLCTDFKAFETTTMLIQSSNHLHYSKEGTLGYQQELKNDTTPKLNFYIINYQT